MKADNRLIEALNEILTGELTGINQYFIHAMMCEHWGYERIAEKVRAESIEEMKHAEELIERILDLEGVPNLQRLEKVKVGEKVAEQFKLDLAMEIVAVGRFNKTVALAVELHDNTTRELLDKMLVSEEEHLHWLESQIELIRQVGEANYLAQQIRK
jgi:bacterioferritin